LQRHKSEFESTLQRHKSELFHYKGPIKVKIN